MLFLLVAARLGADECVRPYITHEGDRVSGCELTGLCRLVL
jgi:hypothetical protein